MTRKEAQKELLTMIDERIVEEGENSVAFFAPQRGKNKWTLKEIRDSVVNDMPLDGLKYNLIDDMLAMDEQNKENNIKTL